MLLLKDIVGQDQAIERLRQAWQADRLPHGMIFAGSPGVGKATTARALAAWFLCEKPGKDDACGQCASCRLVAAGTHPDYHLVYRQLIRLDPKKKEHKASVLSYELIEPYLIVPSLRKSQMGRGKVFVVEEADLLSREAANSMLKTLEEPQGRTLIILLTDQLTTLLPTIRSRCQIFQFQSLPAEFIVKRLTEKGVEAASAKAAATIAEGSLGLALRWTEDGLIGNVRPFYGMLSAIVAGQKPDGLPQLVAQIAAMQVEKEQARDPNISKDTATRESTILLLRLAADFFRSKLPDAAAPTQLRLCRMVDDIAKSQQYIDGNVNVTLVLENLGNRLA